MPTGYTAGIVDGTTTDFKTFATQCMRNFGACIHMRDESFDKPWEPREPSKYYLDNLKEAKLKLDRANNATDEELIAEAKTEKEKSKLHYADLIKKADTVRGRLESFLSIALKFNPPTEEHLAIKNFMVSQLKDTIRFDGDSSYYKECLEKIEADPDVFNAVCIRNQLIEEAEKEIARCNKDIQDENNRCNGSNEWVVQFLQSIDSQK